MFCNFLAEAQFLRVNCDEMVEDKLIQPGDEIFGIKVRF